MVAMDGTTGSAPVRDHRPDLVVLDLATMPDIDGLSVRRRLRKEPRHARLPIIVLSARASAADRVLGLETGADDYLIKPFVPQELVARVKAVLRRSDNQAIPHAIIRVGDLGDRHTRAQGRLARQAAVTYCRRVSYSRVARLTSRPRLFAG